MKVHAAIGFALSGSGLLLSQGTGRARSRLASWLSLAVIGIGLAKLAEYVWSVDPRVEQLFDGSLARHSALLPGRMAELVAVALVLLGGLGLLVSMRRWLYLREGLAVALLGIAITGLASYGIALAGKDSELFNETRERTSPTRSRRVCSRRRPEAGGETVPVAGPGGNAIRDSLWQSAAGSG